MKLKRPDWRPVRRSLLRWHTARGLHAPWRLSRDPYETLVAAVMAQQTQMSRVIPAHERFLAVFPTIEALAAATVGDVIRAWAGMGYNQRAVRLHRAARSIANSGWPRDATSLERIEGIGPFTAAIVASFAFGEPVACVDTNVRRVLGRISGTRDVTEAGLRSLAQQALARNEPALWNQAIMDYGSVVCTPRPRCGECVVAASCVSREDFTAAPRMAAEARGEHRVRERFEDSARYRRGRIIAALRALPPGRSVPVGKLGAVIGNGSAPHPGEIDALVDGLTRDGLITLRRGRIALPA